MEKKDYARAKAYLDKQSEMARTFEMGRYNEVSGYLDFAVSQKNVEETIQIIKEIMSHIGTIEDYAKSFLYEHLGHKQLGESFYIKIKNNILDCLQNDEGLADMRECDEWLKVKMLLTKGIMLNQISYIKKAGCLITDIAVAEREISENIKKWQ